MSAALEAARRNGLLARYSPCLNYHKQEPYWATSPRVMTDCYVEGSYATYLQRKNGSLIAQAGPALSGRRLELDVLNGDTYGNGDRPSATDYLNAHGGTYQEDAARMQRLHGDKVYGRLTQANGGRVWLQYWLFYYFNDKSLAGIGLHEGDWEMIQIGLDPTGTRPEVATYSQHTYREKRDDWKDVRKLDGDDGPPLVFVGLGSHASYFEPGIYRIEPFPLPDHARGGGRRVRPELVEIDRTMRWIDWPGRWGRMGLRDDGSPTGPRFHEEQWFRPDDFHAKAKRRRHKIGPIFLARPDEASSFAPVITAVREGGHVAVEYDFRRARATERTPVRVLLSVDQADEAAAPPSTHSFVVTGERARVVHPAPVGPGRYLVHATAFTAENAASETVTAEVTDAPGTVRDREGFFLRLLVELPDAGRAAASPLRAAAATLGDDADGKPWQVAPLFPPAPGKRAPARLRRHWQVTGRAIASPAYPQQKLAFDIAERLRAAFEAEAGPGAAAAIQPDLPSSAFAPPAPSANGRATPSAQRRGRSPRDTPKDWSLKAINCDAAWKLEPGRGAGVLVGHPDTGFTDHAELERDALDLTRAWDVLARDSDAHDPLERRWWWPLDSPGHGTATGSVIAGRVEGLISGAAPGATLVPFRTVKSVVQVFDGDVAVAVDRARQAGCHVVSMSLGGVGFHPALREAIAAAVDSGMIVMAAAGNEVGFVTAPASLPECLAIGATGITDQPWSGSSHGPQVDFCAPGEGVWVAAVDLDHGAPRYVVEPHNGTSFAVAHAAGAAALWLAHHGPDKLRRTYGRHLQRVFLKLARDTVKKPLPTGWDTGQYGAGVLDARALLEAKLPAPSDFEGAAPMAAGREPAPLDRIATLWPELTADEVRARLATALGKRGQRLQDTIDNHGGELFYAFSQDDELRRRVGAAPRTGVAAAGARRPPADDLRRVASDSLRAALEA